MMPLARGIDGYVWLPTHAMETLPSIGTIITQFAQYLTLQNLSSTGAHAHNYMHTHMHTQRTRARTCPRPRTAHVFTCTAAAPGRPSGPVSLSLTGSSALFSLRRGLNLDASSSFRIFKYVSSLPTSLLMLQVAKAAQQLYSLSTLTTAA